LLSKRKLRLDLNHLHHHLNLLLHLNHLDLNHLDLNHLDLPHHLNHLDLHLRLHHLLHQHLPLHPFQLS
jgi:hypothetical protein